MPMLEVQRWEVTCTWYVILADRQRLPVLRMILRGLPWRRSG